MSTINVGFVRNNATGRLGMPDTAEPASKVLVDDFDPNPPMPQRIDFGGEQNDGPVVHTYNTSPLSQSGRILNSDLDHSPPVPIALDFSGRSAAVQNQKSSCGCNKPKPVTNAGDYDESPPVPVKLDFSHRR